MKARKIVALQFIFLMGISTQASALVNIADLDRTYRHNSELVDDSRLTNRREKKPVVISGEKSRIMTSKVSNVDPFSGKAYSNVMLGKVFQTKRLFNRKYTHYRYITLFNIKKTKERIAFLPSYDEACHDDSFFMAEWGESRTITVTLESQVKAEQLGVSASVGMSLSQGTTFSTARRIKAVKGVEAIHYPYSYKETHVGVTYVMSFNKKTKEYDALSLRGLNGILTKEYPYPYKLDNQNIGFRVKREIISECEDDSFSSGTPGEASRDDDGRGFYFAE